jgi:O-antigen ligase
MIDISQKPPLGWGFNHFKEAGLTFFPGMYGNEAQAVHVTLLQYWYGAGLLGATGFAALFVMPIKRMVAVIKSPANYGTNAVRLGLGIYVSILIIFSLGPYLYNRYLYIPMFLLAGFTSRVWQPHVTGGTVRRPQEGIIPSNK